jgi:hypothetical protein
MCNPGCDGRFSGASTRQLDFAKPFSLMSSQAYISEELAHFVGKAKANDDERYTLFAEIVRGGWLKASHIEESGSGFAMLSDGQKRLSTNEAISCPMLCFCDIPPSQLEVHMLKYGSFGIAFSKKMLLTRGVIPVHYIARDARNHGVGIGPRTVGERYDELRAELQHVQYELDEYVTRIDGPPRFLSKLSPPGTPTGHRLLGRFSALRSEIEELVFAGIKFFASGLPEEHKDNFYMEREWRLSDGLAFSASDIARIILPRAYARRFHDDILDYSGPVELV